MLRTPMIPTDIAENILGKEFCCEVVKESTEILKNNMVDYEDKSIVILLVMLAKLKRRVEELEI